MKTMSLKLPESLDRSLSSVAAARGTTRSLLVREALAAYLAGVSKVSKGSFMDLVGDLVGRHEGPGDLSTNAKHMKRFGK